MTSAAQPTAVSDAADRETTGQGRDASAWLVLVAVGLLVVWAAVRHGAQLGTASAPFLGRYRLHVGAGSLLAPLVAVGMLVGVRRGWLERAPWWAVQLGGYLTALAWALSLAVVDGASGLTRALRSDEEYLTDLPDVGDDPLGYLAGFTHRMPDHTVATRGHPPAPVLLLWALARAGLTDHLALGLLITALGVATVPLVLSAVRGLCGEPAARRYLPVLVLAPYLVWTAVSMDALVALLGAALIAAGVRASRPGTAGRVPAAWALVAGLLIGVAALFSYSAPWLGLSVVLVYFVRRRPWLHFGTGVGTLLPLLAAQLLGFGWVDGLLAAHDDHLVRIEPYRSALWWAGISLVALLLAAGPALYASLRKARNTPGWPFLVGAGVAVVVSIGAGFARGGVEHAWLPFFPWLTVAAVAPARQGGVTPPTPWLLAGVGAVVAVVVEAVLATPW